MFQRIKNWAIDVKLCWQLRNYDLVKNENGQVVLKRKK